MGAELPPAGYIRMQPTLARRQASNPCLTAYRRSVFVVFVTTFHCMSQNLIQVRVRVIDIITTAEDSCPFINQKVKWKHLGSCSILSNWLCERTLLLVVIVILWEKLLIGGLTLLLTPTMHAGFDNFKLSRI